MKPAIVSLALLDGYKVRWNRKTVARDVVQNFFDAAADFADVTIDVRGDGTVRVEGPATFDFDYLRYLGATSKRATRAAGGFGEGFKICALVLLRDYEVGLRAGSGAWEIRPFFQPMKFGRELCYEVVRHDPSAAPKGSWVEITGADGALSDAFAEARVWFRHPQNPRLQRPLHVDDAAGIGVYFALEPTRGDVFYRRQHRGSLAFSKGAGLSFACDDRVEGIEADRDRRGIRAPSRVAGAVMALLPIGVIERIVRHLRPYWQDGNAVLALALGEAARRGERFSFASRWVARGTGVRGLEEHAERRGCLLAIAAFAGVGMPTAEARFGDAQRPRRPTPTEAARIAVAHELYEALLEDPAPTRRVTVREAPGPSALLGGARGIQLPSSVLAARFEDGIGALLAALARQEGEAGRTNAIRLTKLMEAVLAQAGRFDAFRERWARAAELSSLPGERGHDDDEPSDDNPTAHRITVVILAPDGFPPADEIERRVREAARKLRATITVARIPVHGGEDAAHQYARGVPSVWIGEIEIEPPRGKGPRYDLRTFAGPDGPTLSPHADVLEKALSATLARGKPSRSRILGKRLLRGREAFFRWMAKHRPSERMALLVSDVIHAYVEVEEARGEHPQDFWNQRGMFAWGAARRALEEEGPRSGDARWATLEAHIARACGAYDELVVEMERRLEALSEIERITPGVRLSMIATNLATALPLAEVQARMLPLFDAAASLYAAAHALPLDETCRGACVESALGLLCASASAAKVGADRDGPERIAEAAARRATAQLVEAARIATELHGKIGSAEAGSSCFGLSAVLAARFEKKPRARAAKPSAVARATRAAWDEALAAGLDEVVAARRAMAVAERVACDEAERAKRREGRK